MSAGTVPFPPGSCDTHMHFYDSRYPVAPAALLRPPDADVAAYREVQAELGLQRVVVVQPTTYGLDNSCQLDHAAAFGSDARLVVVVDPATSDGELARLHERGARGVRFHLLPGGAVGWDALPVVAARVAELGWHVQLQLNGRELADCVEQLAALPGELVIDHVGRFMPPVAVDHEAARALFRLLDGDRTWVKLSAPYEADAAAGPAYGEVGALARALVAHRPDRLLWATNWPHPGQDDPPGPAALRGLFHDWVSDPDLRRAILVDNPARCYDFPDQGAP